MQGNNEGLQLQWRATDLVWTMADGDEPFVVGVRLDCGDSGTVYLTREQASDLSAQLGDIVQKLGIEDPDRWVQTIELGHRMNPLDTGTCPECGGIRPDHTLEEWRNCDGKSKVGLASLHYHDHTCLRFSEDRQTVYCDRMLAVSGEIVQVCSGEDAQNDL